MHSHFPIIGPTLVSVWQIQCWVANHFPKMSGWLCCQHRANVGQTYYYLSMYDYQGITFSFPAIILSGRLLLFLVCWTIIKYSHDLIKCTIVVFVREQDRWTNGQIDGQLNGQMDDQTDRQTDRQSHVAVGGSWKSGHFLMTEQIAIQCWANIAKWSPTSALVCQCWPQCWQTSQTPKMVGKWLASQRWITNLMPTLG